MKHQSESLDKQDICQRLQFKSTDKVQFKSTKNIAEQLNEAVAYFKENGCKGYSAVVTGQFPLIKDACTINR